MTCADDDPDEIFEALTNGMVLEEPEDVGISGEQVSKMSTSELIGMLSEVEDALMESKELLLPRSDWGQDMHNLRFALRQEVSRRHIAP